MLFERETEGVTKQVRRTLFGLMNPYPQKKIITFNKHTTDFTFSVNYAELDYLPPREIERIGSLNITQVSLTGVAEAFKKHLADNVETKGIKAHFIMDDSGILSLLNVDLVVEKEVASEAEEDGPFSKLGSTISKLFGAEENAEKPVHEEPEAPPKQEEKAEQPEQRKNETSQEAKNQTKEADKKEEEKKDAKPKVITIKEPIKASESFLATPGLTESQLEESAKKLQALNAIDRELYRRAAALNNLESFIIDVQNKMYEDEYSEAATEEELEKIKASCSEISDWLYDDGAEADADTYEQKLSSLKALTKSWFSRVFEHRERPEALNALETMLNGSRAFLASAKNLTKATNPDKDVFTDVEIKTLDDLVKDTEEWRDKQTEEQDKLKKYEAVKLTVKSLTEKMASLDREVKYLVNKLKIWKPKKVEKPKEQKTVPDAKAGKDKNEDAEEVKESSGTSETPESSQDVPPTEKEEIQPSETVEEEPHTEL